MHTTVPHRASRLTRVPGPGSKDAGSDMRNDLAPVRSAVHCSLLQEELVRAGQDAEIIGVMVVGSVARGDALPGSDLDLYLLLRDGCARPFERETETGVVVERKFRDATTAAAGLDGDPMQVYDFLNGRILRDPQGRLAALRAVAARHFAEYRAPASERRALASWLRSARGKTLAARDAGDTLKAAYVVGSISWKLIEGVWLACHRPVPPCGAVWAHVGDLVGAPLEFETQLRDLFLGDTTCRVVTFLMIAHWVVPLLKQ